MKVEKKLPDPNQIQYDQTSSMMWKENINWAKADIVQFINWRGYFSREVFVDQWSKVSKECCVAQMNA